MILNVYAGPWDCDTCGDDLQYLSPWITRCTFCGMVYTPKVATRAAGGFRPRYEVVIRA